MRIWAFNDPHEWGSGLIEKAQARGHTASLFDDCREPDGGYLFFHMHHHPAVRVNHKRMMAVLSTNPNLVLVPDYRSSVLYDDKCEQARQLAKWMPRTHIFYTPGAARRFLDKEPVFPLISKTSEGAASHNVRMIADAVAARSEIRRAFSDIGIRCQYGQAQRGYVLWQEFIAGNPGDIRIIAIGSKRLLLRRSNRDDRPMASGSGRIHPVVNLDEETASALSFANRFFESEGFQWCGIDLVRGADGRWFVLETTVGWTLNGYYDCAFFTSDGRPDGRMGSEVWDVLLDEIEAGVFDPAKGA